MSAIQEAIKAAQTAAGEIMDAEVTSETLPASYDGAAPAVVNYAKPSMANMGTSTGISNQVSNWLKVDEFGLSIGSDKKKFDKLLFTIDMIEDKGFYVKESIKWGDPVNYASRYGGPLADNGEPWAEVVARARRIAPSAKIFPSADIILTSVNDIELKGKDPKTPEKIDAGDKIGLGLAMSNWQNWVEFHKDVMVAGMSGTTVTVEISGVEVNSKKGYTWGVCSFKLIE